MRNPAKQAAAIQRWRANNRDKDHATQQRRRAAKLAAPRVDFTAAEWEQLKQQYHNQCAYCDATVSLTQDHIVPLSKGGSHTLTNILPACQSCNSRKGNRSVYAFLASLPAATASQAA